MSGLGPLVQDAPHHRRTTRVDPMSTKGAMMTRSKSSGRNAGEPKPRVAGAEPRASGAKRATKAGPKPAPPPDAALSDQRGRKRARPAPVLGSEVPDVPTSVIEALPGVESNSVVVRAR